MIRSVLCGCLLVVSACTIDRRPTSGGGGAGGSGGSGGAQFGNCPAGQVVTGVDPQSGALQCMALPNLTSGAPGSLGASPGIQRADGIIGCEYDATQNIFYYTNYNQGSIIRIDGDTRNMQAIYFGSAAPAGTWVLRTRHPTSDMPELWVGDAGSTTAYRTTTDVPTIGMSNPSPGTIALPFGPMGVAEAGRNEDGTAGGYSGNVADYFVLQPNQLELWSFGGTSTMTLIANLAAVTTTVATRMVNRPIFAFGIDHDPATKRILIGDRSNGLVWIFGYDAPNGMITLRGTVASAWGTHACDTTYCYMLRCIAYDRIHKLLWTGNYDYGSLSSVPLDLSRF